MGADWRGGPSIWHSKSGDRILQVSGIHPGEFRWGVFVGPYATKQGRAADLDAAKAAAEEAAWTTQ